MEVYDASPEVLSRRERQVVALMSSGLRMREVAEMLCLATRTIDSTRQSAYDKLGIHDRVRLSLWAHRHGLDIESPVMRKPPLARSDDG